MKRIKKIINGVIAMMVFELPFIFPNEIFLTSLFVIGLITLTVLTFKGLQAINK